MNRIHNINYKNIYTYFNVNSAKIITANEIIPHNFVNINSKTKKSEYVSYFIVTT